MTLCVNAMRVEGLGKFCDRFNKNRSVAQNKNAMWSIKNPARVVRQLAVETSVLATEKS